MAIAAGAPVDSSIEEVVATASQVSSSADVIEIRLDTLSRPEVKPFFHALGKPLLFTNRPAWEGGFFTGNEEARLLPLLEAVQCGASYVDLELQAAGAMRDQLLNAVRQTATKMIISWHNFIETPENDGLAKIFYEQLESGAHIGKIVTMAHNFKDVLRVLNLQLLAAENDFPLIAFCMGRPGIISRLATIELGGYMTYAVPDRGVATAAGQLPVTDLRRIMEKLFAGPSAL